MACCSLHLLKFCPIDEETPDFGEELSKLSSGRCQRKVSLRGRPAVRVPLCAEDVEETDEASLFGDEDIWWGIVAQAGLTLEYTPGSFARTFAMSLTGRPRCLAAFDSN